MTRAVITGLGITAPNGVGVEQYWAALLAGRSGLSPITRFDAGTYPVQVAGEVPDFVATDRIPSRLTVQTDRWTHLGLGAAELALADAKADPATFPEYEIAVVTASSSGGTEFGQVEIEKLWSKGPRAVGAYQSIAWFYAATTGQISIRHGMRGPCGVISAEQAGGLDSLGHARRLLRGEVRLVVSGGTDASLCPYGLVAQMSTGRLSHGTDPATAFLPFDTRAAGYVPGEGGAMLIAESLSRAEERNAPQVYGEIAGYAATFDPAPGSGRPPGLRRAITGALRDAGLGPDDVDVVFADAAGVPDLDRAEVADLEAVFGARGVPVTVPKTLTGRLYAGGAALDVATALLALRDGLIPPTAGVTSPAFPDRLDLVGAEAREAPLRTALVLARGYGGFNAALVVRAL